MKKSIVLFFIALFCFCGYAQTIDPVLLQEMGRRNGDEKIKIIVIMKSQYDRQQLDRRATHYATRAERREFVVNELKQFAEASQYDLRRSLDEMEQQGLTTAPKIIWMANALYFSATKQAINDLAMRRDIELIGLDEEKQVELDEEAYRPKSIPSGLAWNIAHVKADKVWDLGYTGQGVVVASIDSGVNYKHVDFADHLWDGGEEYPNHGWDFCNDDNDPMDEIGHGTACAGIICGDGTSGCQTGMAPDVSLMCVKVQDSNVLEASIICSGMQWAVEHGADVLNLSFGIYGPSLTERILFRNTCDAILDAGVVCAVGAGNKGKSHTPELNVPNNIALPASCPPPYMDSIQESNPGGLSSVICVGGVDTDDQVADFTSQGPVTWADTEFGDYPYTPGSATEFGLIRPDVSAPGVDIISTYFRDTIGYTIGGASSSCAPCITGCIAFMLSKNNNLTPADLCRILEETAVSKEEGKSNTIGYGCVDALAAVNAVYSGPLTLESYSINDEQGNNDGKLNAGEAVTLELSLLNDSDIPLDGTTLVLSTESEFVTITNGTATLPHLDAGQSQTIEDIFVFTLSEDALANRSVFFTVKTYVDGDLIGSFKLGIKVYGHLLKFDEVTVLNDSNSNGTLEAGETADLHVVISNVGNEPATAVVGTLSTLNPDMVIDEVTATFGDIEVDGQASADFNVTLSGDAPEIYVINLSLDLADDNGKQTNAEFKIVKGMISFADVHVKSLCVSRWDTNGDGELSYAEAAAVTSLEEVFQYRNSITSFDELQYFNGLTSIGNSEFISCKNLTSIAIPNSVTYIDKLAFKGCIGLTSISVLAETPPSLGNYVFYKVDKSIPVYVPCGSLEAYQNANGWNEFTDIQEDCSQSQAITLTKGYNWWSSYIELSDIDGLGQLENSIGMPRVFIQSKSNGSVESIRQNGQVVWQGTLSSINNEEMYKIATKVACTAMIEGNVTTPSRHPITINKGWNSIGFPCSQSVSVNVALSGFTPKNNDMIKGINSYATFSNGTWSGTLNSLEPGQGYMYGSKNRTPKTLVFQTGRGEDAIANITPENNFFQPSEDYADNMTLTAVVELDGVELRSDDYELAAFVGDECRGSVKLMYVESIDRYITFLTIFGDQEEDLHFRLTDGIATSLSTDRLAYANDDILGSLDNPVVLHFGPMDVEENAMADVKVYPNPSEGIFNIEGQNIRKVEVFNALGQPVYAKDSENGLMMIDLMNHAAGIYLVRVVTDNGIVNHQVMKR